MNDPRAEQIAVKTDAFGRPVCFLRACDDNRDEVIMIDGWAGHWVGREGEQNADTPEMWMVTAQGVVYDLHPPRKHGEVVGQLDEEVWTATRAR